jgi:MFS family permease
MAKVADVLGRLEAFSFSVFLFIIGYIQMATSQNVQTFASAQIFYSAGGTGLQILTQVFIADTSDLLNRALWSSLPDVPFLITVWVGPIASQRISTVWRWGYGMWTIILPVAFLPLALSLFLNQRKADRLGLLPPSPWKNLGSKVLVKKFLREVDAVGILLLSTAFALILIPLTIAAKAWAGWNTPSIITMLILGPLCLVAFPFWEKNKRLAPQPLVPLEMLRSRTFCCGCLLGFFYFSMSAIFTPFLFPLCLHLIC